MDVSRHKAFSETTPSCLKGKYETTPNVALGQPHGWPKNVLQGHMGSPWDKLTSPPKEPVFSSSLALLAFNHVPSTTRSSPIRRVGESNPNLPLFSFPCHHGGPGTRPALNKMNSPKVACYETLAANLLLALAFKVEMLWGTHKGANVLYPYIVGWCEVHYIPNQLNCSWVKKSWGQSFILPLCDIKNLATFFKNKTTSGMIFILWDKIEVLLGTCWGMYLRMHRSSHFFLALMTNVRSSTLTRPNDTHWSSHIDGPIRSVVPASPAHSLCCKCFPWHVAPTRLSFLHPHSVCF
jgi:hypothetical protein